MDVGDGDFRGGDQVQIVHFAVVHIVGHLGQLAGAGHGIGIGHERNRHFAVSLLKMDVDHEVGQSPLQARPLSHEHGESGAGHTSR